MNLKHPHDVVIFMRQETRVNHLKKLEVKPLNLMMLTHYIQSCVLWSIFILFSHQ